MRRFQKFRLSLPLSLLAAVLLAGCITLLALWCQPNALRAVLQSMKAQPLLIVLNAMPAGLLLLLFACLFRNVFFGAALTNLLVCGFSIANRIKIEVRDEPVFPRDLALLKEVGVIVSDYDIHFPWAAITLVLATTAVLIVLGFFIGGKPFPVPGLRGWAGRLLGTAASLGVLTALTLSVYASNDLYNSFKTSNPYYVPAVFNDLGFPYCFFHHFTTYAVDRPDGFSRSQAEAWENAAVAENGGKPVHVVMVMNEAFSDITDHSTFAFEEEPLPNLQAMRQDPNAITGHIVVPGFAAGTANTEFDVLTGIQTNALSATTTSAMRVVNRNLDSLFRVYGADGYHTSYFHPGDDWFYNRENVLRWMGAKSTVFADQMKEIDYKGRWVTDEYLTGLIRTEFEDTVADGDTLFHYMTTIQNHMSYTVDKYGADHVYPEVPLNLEVSDSVQTMLNVYTEGAQDADAMLGALRDYFASRQEPVLLVFFGDHLPYLGDNQLGYSELGFTSEEHWSDLASYKTPYVIWGNDAAAKTLGWTDGAPDLPETLSASFLGAAVLELTGHDAGSAWFSFLNGLRQEAPVIHRQTTMLSDGTILTGDTGSAALSDAVSRWRQWSYYKLKYQEFQP